MLIDLKAVSQTDVLLVGGKAASLGELTQAGYNVPAGFVITTEVYTAFNNQNLPEDLQQQILTWFDELGVERVSIRSSARAEDSSASSWAGQFASYLNVGRPDVIANIYKCWQSVHDAQAYARQQDNPDMTQAVIVQAMVNSDVSGVVFTQNPITKNNEELMIEAVRGLGDQLVQGLITPDNYVVSKTDLTIGSNTKGAHCLNDAAIIELTKLAVRIEQQYAAPQDIEWCLSDDTFYILQSRPITA